jgi:hypothetical protein
MIQINLVPDLQFVIYFSFQSLKNSLNRMMGPEIDVAALSQLSSENLRVLLRKIPGTKDLIIEQSLMKPLDKFAAMSLIKSCGVDRVFRLEKNAPGNVTSSIRLNNCIRIVYGFENCDRITKTFCCQLVEANLL